MCIIRQGAKIAVLKMYQSLYLCHASAKHCLAGLTLVTNAKIRFPYQSLSSPILDDGGTGTLAAIHMVSAKQVYGHKIMHCSIFSVH